MAGRGSAACAPLLGDEAPIVRAMPNTPAAVRQGMTVACAGPGVTPAQRGAVRHAARRHRHRRLGRRRGLLDPVTAVSGSGPAYVFLLAELLEQAAIEQGIPA